MTFPSPTLCAAAVGLVVASLCASASAQSTAQSNDNPRARVARAAPGHALTPPSSAAPSTVVQGYLRAHGASAATAASLRASEATRGKAGMTHLRMTQEVGGLAVYGRYAKAAVNARGELVQLIERLAPVPAAGVAPARVNARQALQAAMARVHPSQAVPAGAGMARGNATEFVGGAFFHADPSATPIAIALADGRMEQGYLVETWTTRDNLLQHTLVGADGAVLNVETRTANDSYRVFKTDPGASAQTVEPGPAPAAAAPSPLGWLGAGAQTTTQIGGNNVSAYLDADANDKPDTGGAAVTDGNFLATVDLGATPTTATNRAVAVQNLFYLNNRVHDILYRHGFNETAGNFQVDNFGKGGSGKDPVLAEAQDGSGTDNANFATPRDGRSGRMQMYLWTGAGPTHDVVVNTPVARLYDAKGADFGATLTAAGLTGDIAPALPADGCTAITSSVAGKVALIDRGACDFSIKALNAQKAGAVGVIVVNNVATAPITMGEGASANRVNIPAVMISQADGTELKGLGAANVTEKLHTPQPLQLDASLDSDVVFHEYGHGLTWRMIGGMDGPMAGAIGEGAADGVALLINGDDAIGEYSAGDAAGIRRHRYTGYPLTYKDVTGGEVHNDGEVFAAIVWRLIELFRDNGIPRDTLFTYYVDGMNYTPATPAFEDMRDGMLAAVANGGTPAHCALVWKAFAQYGVGVGATSNVGRTAIAVTESKIEGVGCQ